MGFEGLLGNERLKENLRVSVGRGRSAHFYLISGPAGSGKKTLAKLLTAALQCQSEEKPCLTCPACRKVLNDTHPDCITVIDRDHKTVAVDIVRNARADMYVVPNEGQKKIYIFPQELRIEGQNALLKILEEPPQYGVFILLTDNPEKLLPTVRSRCTELNLLALPEGVLTQALKQEFPNADPNSIAAAVSRSGGFLGQAKALLEQGAEVSPQTEGFVNAFAHRDEYGIVCTLAGMEKWKRDVAIPEWQLWLQLLQSALSSHSGQPTVSPLARELAIRSSVDLVEAIGHLQKVIEYAQGNVSVGACCGYLMHALR
jgi:DNA polymerase-3 subunit delta'